MDKYIDQEIQRGNSEFIITLLSDEVIRLPFVNNENISEDYEGCVTIDLELPVHVGRLYEAFKNKELIQSIVRKSTYTSLKSNTGDIIEHTFTYDTYCKIDRFNSSTSTTGHYSCDITFKSV